MGRRISATDVAAGLAGRALKAVEVVSRRVGPVVEPAVHLAARPPLLPERLQPERWLDVLAQEGAEQKAVATWMLSRWSDVLVPTLLEQVLRRARLTQLLLQYVDLDAVVSAVDLDAAATRLDVDSVVERVDVNAVVDRVDLDVAARRLDLEPVLDRMDLTSLVLERVDLDVIVQAVLERIDLVGLAEEVIDGVDLPEIIRESTGSMASDTVRGVRMQGIVADEAVGRTMDRLLLRRGRRSTEAPVAASPSDQEPAVPSQRDPGR